MTSQSCDIAKEDRRILSPSCDKVVMVVIVATQDFEKF